MPNDPRVQQLLDALLNSDSTPEEVCGSSPELLPEVRTRWQQMRRVRAELDALFPVASKAGDDATPVPHDPTILPHIPGYEVEALLGHGGMGVVYKARHLALKRTVALKMLAGGRSDPAEHARFKAEAEAIARLQHPNIVQIHEVGESDDRPFIALEFVEGGSLATRLEGQVLPPRDAARLVAMLADAMHLAHSRNLVHRDLKPANVLLTGSADTPIGQCQPKVSDFGLARQLDTDSTRTHVGVIIGTPSYMAPEQAEGLAHAAGPAADVYALGAILYECLTGQPPFKGATPRETLEQVRTQEPAAPSRLRRQVPRDLETACLKCLRKQPEQRYSSARELADDLGRFVRGEPVAARPVGVAESVRKWVWRRPAAAGLLFALLLSMAAGGVGAWLLYQQKTAAWARQAQTDQAVRGILERASAKLEEGWQAADLTKLKDAEAEVSRAEDVARSGGASAAVRQEVEALIENAAGRLERAKRNHILVQSLLDASISLEASAYLRDETNRTRMLAQPSVDEQFSAAFRTWGLDVDGRAEVEVVARLNAEPGVVVQELIAALDNWMLERRRQKQPEERWRLLYRVAEQLDRNERHRRLRALLIGDAPPRAQDVAGLVGGSSPWTVLGVLGRGTVWPRLLEMRREIDPRTEPALTVALLAQAFVATGDAANAERVLSQAVTARPDQVVLLDLLGKLLEQQAPSRLEEAIGYYRAARVQRHHLGISLSRALIRAGRPSQAEDVMRELVRLQPEHSSLWFYLGNALNSQEKSVEAEGAFRKAIALKPNFPEAYYNLGIVLSNREKDGEAEEAYRKAIAFKPDLAEAHTNLGNTLVRCGKYDEAEAACRKALDLKPGLVEAHNNLGNALMGQRRHGEAEAAYRNALELRPNLAAVHANLGTALFREGKRREAEEAFRKAIDLKPDLAEAHTNLGALLAVQGRYDEAEAACRKALDLKPGYTTAYLILGITQLSWPRHGEAEEAYRKALDLGNARSREGKHREAEEAFRKAIDHKPDLAGAHYNLGNALSAQGKYDAAEEAYRKAIDLKPRYAQAYTNLGNALFARGERDAAEAAFRKAIDLESDLVEAHHNLGNALSARGDHSGAEAAFRKAIDLKPDLFEAHYNLGHALRQQIRFDEASASFKKAGLLRPGQNPLREQAQRFEQECERSVVLNARLRTILEGTEKLAGPDEQIEFAQLCHLKQHYAAAARFARDAFAAEPKLGEAVSASTRYNAACAAVLVGCGQGKDADELDAEERTQWRRQAHDWLRQDLTWWDKSLDIGCSQTNARVRQMMRHWQTDSDLVGVRAKDALVSLSAEERKRWEKLWADVDALLQRASKPE